MDKRKFNIWNRVAALTAFLVAAVTYLLTIEPTASFWDCGEFIASSYKLEVGHPPGNPVFQLIARFCTMFTDNMHAAVAVNSMSAICSALTIFFLYLTIVFFSKRIVKPDSEGRYSTGKAIAIWGSGLVGSLTYCFTDTFWFSAVEGEVYGMSSLFTALVFWAMTKWYDEADQPYANRWIVLISFLMGLSIGVHLLNLLTIPCLVFIWFYRKSKGKGYTFLQYLGIFALSCVILAVILFLIIPYVPKLAAYFDLLFVNVFNLPYNTGAVFFLLLLFGLCFWGLFHTMKKGKAVANTILLCFTTIIVGFSIFAIVVIRSSVHTPTNEYQPDNPFTLCRYLSREQYGSTPIIYGQYFDADYSIEDDWYWAPVDGKYEKVPSFGNIIYDSSDKMLFPRMWNSGSGGDDRYREFYASYMSKNAKRGDRYRKPTFMENMAFFFDYQLNWMYWRYFMWNFAGRQNDCHSPSPGEIFLGNWESGITFIDQMRLGDQSMAPDYLKENKGKNHYYMLPLLLGLIGLFYQLVKDDRGCWLTFLLFFMTGIAIVVYLNQPPFQVRERDYAYAGSFYAFSIWVGFAVLALYDLITKALSRKKEPAKAVSAVAATAVSLLCLGVPALMAEENWDDHDRSNRRTAVEMARNYLNSCGENGILITHGDNDTFPLWYAQEVEEVRPDVRIVNTSLLGTDWHIDQMKWACNESAPLDLTVGPRQYLYGTNEFVYIYDSRNSILPLKDVMRVFKEPRAKLQLQSGKGVNYICSRKFSIPVNKENVIKYGILDEKYIDQIPDSIVFTISEGKNYISKPELFMLDLLSNYKWDRPLHMLNMGGDLNMGIKEYLEYDGFSYKFVPISNRQRTSEVGFSDPERLYRLMTEVYTWDALSYPDYYADNQHLYTFCGVLSQRGIFVNAAKEMIKAGWPERAVELLDKCQEAVPEGNYPLDMSYLGFSNELMVMDMINLYYMLDEPEKASDLAVRFLDKMFQSVQFFFEFYDYAEKEFDRAKSIVLMVQDIAKDNADEAVVAYVDRNFDALLEQYTK
ncbi:MAG: DUF2723 domain-containing protein [Candidatus Cryptobacteroides sp.]|nr:DUF2723 domain-containing protein [Candidatus Cryptobacteroides sp.]